MSEMVTLCAVCRKPCRQKYTNRHGEPIHPHCRERDGL